MQHDHQNEHDDNGPSGGRFWLPVSTFAVALGFFLFYEHRAHIPADYLFAIVFLLLCGGMHFFMHGGHGGHGDHKNHMGHKEDSSQQITEEDNHE